ncbi:Lysm domain receptor-like kinase [Thalictrum thalictroides]|uniref:Lysm domain receptor-like kinase n=1 Tax=Thalictrum thalictroides TaxID=46969 RepID=A0A7J6WSB7_THATH|nr:Lysm domain receptor-like kinase [Thalictrum thalictroides]
MQFNNSYLYHISDGSTTTEQIASYYSVNKSQVKPIYRNTNKDYLVSVPCACKELNNIVAYFYDTTYTVQQNDTLKTWMNVTNKFYSGQAWNAGDGKIDTGQVLPIHLVCGCVGGSQSQVVVTYTIQDHDTLPQIATSLASTLEGIES